MSKLVNQQSFYVVNLATCDALVAALVMPLKALEYMAPACEWSVFRSDTCGLLLQTARRSVVGVPQ